ADTTRSSDLRGLRIPPFSRAKNRRRAILITAHHLRAALYPGRAHPVGLVCMEHPHPMTGLRVCQPAMGLGVPVPPLRPSRRPLCACESAPVCVAPPPFVSRPDPRAFARPREVGARSALGC